MSKLIINLDATSLGHSACIKDLYQTIIGSLGDDGLSQGGYKEKANGPELTYGVAVHKFIDVAYKTSGDLVRARKKALELFDNIPTNEPPKKQWLRDRSHLSTVCFNTWNDFIVEESSFELLNLVLPCWLCRGVGTIKGKSGIDYTAEFGGGSEEVIVDVLCPFCKGEKLLLQPATEVTFSIKYYEDDYIIVNLCGTIDKIGKFRGGCYAIGDWKTSSTWNTEEYFEQYQLARQLRMYLLAIKLMGIMYPESVLGHLAKTNPGCFIDAIFLDKDANKSKVQRSPEIYQVKPADLDAFQMTLDDVIKRVSSAVKTGYIPKEGIINGSCIKYQNVSEKNFVKCIFWNACRNDDRVGEILLKRDFKRVQFDPLNYNEI